MSNGRDWTPDDKATLRRLVAAGMTHAQIGERMDRNPKFIGRKARDLDLAPGVSRGLRAMLARIGARRMTRMARV